MDVVRVPLKPLQEALAFLFSRECSLDNTIRFKVTTSIESMLFIHNQDTPKRDCIETDLS